MDLKTITEMKNILSLNFPHFYGKVNEDPDYFLFEIESLCRSYDYSSYAQKLKLFPTTLKDSALHEFMGLRGRNITSWDQMKRVLLTKYQHYCKTREMQDEISSIVQGDDETLEDYLEIFLYILQRSKHKFEISTIRTLLLRGLTE